MHYYKNSFWQDFFEGLCLIVAVMAALRGVQTGELIYFVVALLLVK